MAKISFFADKVRNGKPKNGKVKNSDGKNGAVLILATFTFDHDRLRLSTGIHFPVKAWDKDHQKAKPEEKYGKDNKDLRDIRSFLLDTYTDLRPRVKKLDAYEVEKLKNAIKEKFQVRMGRTESTEPQKTDLLAFILTFQERYKTTFTSGRIRHYTALRNHLKAFQDASDVKVDFNTIDKAFYIKFIDYLTGKGLKPNTVGSQIQRLKRIMAEAAEESLTINMEFKKKYFKVSKVEVDSIYLTVDEIEALYKMDIDDPRKKRIRDLFVMHCFTGQRYGDWHKFKLESIRDGNFVIERVQKTKSTVIIPVKPLVLEIIKAYDNLLPVPTNQEIDRTLKRIGEDAKADKLPSSDPEKWLQIRCHTARRSFATNGYLAGIPILDLMKITDHHTTEAFMRYIKVTKLETANRLKDNNFFKGITTSFVKKE